MDILRKPPYPLIIRYDGLDNLSEYTVVIEDATRLTDPLLSQEVVSDNTGEIEVELEGDFVSYDDSYSLKVLDAFGDIVIEDNLNIFRPYVDPSTLGSTLAEVATATYNEKLARAIIDSITGGFYFQIDWIETTGEGTDYIPIWDRVYRIVKAYENSVLDYDVNQTPAALGEYNYLVTKDKSSIIKDPVTPYDGINRLEGAPQKPPLVGLSDAISPFETDDSGFTFTFKPGSSFPKGVDYLFVVEKGYKVVPQDIKDATLMLINDIDCGKLDYYKRYITSYSTDQFKIQMDKSVIDGTGNILVDKILDKYITAVKKPRIL